MITIDKKREELLDSTGHMLVLGGPGSGKTTIALHKAGHDIRSGLLQPGQRILFLSFARATRAKIIQQASEIISESEWAALEISTYHSFSWNLLRSHGYLLRAGSPIRLLAPAAAAARLAHIQDDAQREKEKQRLFAEEGLLHFDLFAPVAHELLARSKALARIVGDTYPCIILDEFQDTNSAEWKMIQVLARGSRLIALGDKEQRIYEFRGADPERINEFAAAFSPEQFDFGGENNRSTGTDIVAFGNDMLSGANKGKEYNNVEIIRYRFYKNRDPLFWLKTSLLRGINRQIAAGSSLWSIVVLVPSNRLMLKVSDYLVSTKDKLPTVYHDVAIDAEGPTLAATLIADLLEGGATADETAQRLFSDLCTYIRGRRGSKRPTKTDLALMSCLESCTRTGGRRIKYTNIMGECQRIAAWRHALQFTGNPGDDWVTIRRFLAESSEEEFKQVAEMARYIRLLHKGATLGAKLSELWRTHGSYQGVAQAVQDALLQEYFAASFAERKGVQVMTLHKSKGKEFDEVFIYEGSHEGKIVRAKATSKETAQARLALRVGVTRARQRATILTPINDVCCFL